MRAELVSEHVLSSVADGLLAGLGIDGAIDSALSLDHRPALIEKAVCEAFNLPRKLLRSPRKVRTIVQARAVALYLMRRHDNGNLASAARRLGYKCYKNAMDHVARVGCTPDLMRVVDDISSQLWGASVAKRNAIVLAGGIENIIRAACEEFGVSEQAMAYEGFQRSTAKVTNARAVAVRAICLVYGITPHDAGETMNLPRPRAFVYKCAHDPKLEAIAKRIADEAMAVKRVDSLAI
jgi:hypothetical protein